MYIDNNLITFIMTAVVASLGFNKTRDDHKDVGYFMEPKQNSNEMMVLRHA